MLVKYHHRVGLEDRRFEEGRGGGGSKKSPDHGSTCTLTSNRDLRRGSADHRNALLEEFQSVDNVVDRQVGRSVGGHKTELRVSEQGDVGDKK